MRALGQSWGTIGADTTSSRPTTLTPPASTNTKGAWAQLVASLNVPVNGMLLSMSTERAGPTDFLFDIGVGAAASEVVVAPNLYAGCTTAQTNEIASLWIPIRLAAGQRVSARYQASNITSEQAFAQLIAYGCGPFHLPGFQLMEAIGVDTSDSGGTSVDAGGTANTKGSWVELTASTANPYKALIVCFGNQANDARAGCSWLVDIGVGAGGSEVTLVGNVPGRVQAATDLLVPRYHGPFPTHIPAGTRLAARAQCSINTAGSRVLDVMVYGLT